jgi:anti-anti-sigma factor
VPVGIEGFGGYVDNVPAQQDLDPDERLSIEVVDHHGDAVRLAISGSVDLGNCVELYEAVTYGLSYSRVELDLSGIVFMDSTGLAALVRAGVGDPGHRVTIIAASPRMERLIRVSGFADWLSD